MSVTKMIYLVALLTPFSYQDSQKTRADASPAFEVASVRQNSSGSDRSSLDIVPGRLVATNTTLLTLITYAYNIDPAIQRHLVVGSLEGLLSTRFDISATIADGAEVGQERLMLRRLLAERFDFAAHIETREVPVYAITVAREDRLGPELRPSKHNCVVFRAARKEGRDAVEPTDDRGRSWCAGSYDFGLPDGIGVRHAGAISDLFERVQAFADRPLVNRTGLTGDFEWTLRFNFVPFPPPNAESPSLATAFQEQLGLKLQPDSALIDVLVIDTVSMPTPN